METVRASLPAQDSAADSTTPLSTAGSVRYTSWGASTTITAHAVQLSSCLAASEMSSSGELRGRS